MPPGAERDTVTGTPQGGILSPLLSNVALAVLDEHFAEAWTAMGATSAARQQLRLNGQATYRLVRYADDFVVLVAGTREHAEHLCDVSAAVLQPMGLILSDTKTKIVHIDEGFDFLGYASSGTKSEARRDGSSTATRARPHWPK